MKRILLFVLLTIVLGLFGCAHTISRVEQRWGPPARVEQQGDYTIYHYSFNKVGRRGSGVLNVTLTCDNVGRILSKSQTWEPSQSIASLPSPYMKKKVATVQPLQGEAGQSNDPPEIKKEVAAIEPPPQEAEVSTDSPEMKKESGVIQRVRQEGEASAVPPDTKDEVGTAQPVHEEGEVSADPPETDPDVTLNVGLEGPPEGRGVYYDGPFDIDGISLYFYGGGFYYVAPGYPHRLLFHHRCPPGRLEFQRNHWRSGWHGFHDRWVQSHKQHWKNDPKPEIHHDARVNKANTSPPQTYTSSKASTPPQKTYTPPSKVNAPPSKTYASSKPYTPPQKAYNPPQRASTPPQRAYTPPPRAYTPPQKAYTPPPKQAPTPIRYTPPPKRSK